MRYNVMLKPASALCNLRCKYCFYCDIADLREVRSFGVMTQETTRDILNRLEESLSPGDEITIAFQGGEPCMAGLDSFRRFCGGFCKRMQREVCCEGSGSFCGYREFLMRNLPALQQIAAYERRARGN